MRIDDTIPPVLPLPMDAQLDTALAALAAHGALVLTAPPGSGKSTRLPPALVGATGQVLLLQPRRVAARSLARRIASERNWELGCEVGFQVRFEKVGNAATKLWVMTEGTLSRRLQDDPYLDGVAVVVLDEFHERSVHTDLCLAWCAELRRTVRPDLRVVVMSATLDATPVAAFLGNAPILHVPTPTYPVNIRHEAGDANPRTHERLAAAVHAALADPEGGDVLVFLPGAGEIRGAAAALAGCAATVLPLHGQLPAADQDAALAPDPQGRRKVVLATNVAETSVTIPGVRTVIDSGLARVSRFDSDAGLDRLTLERISRASADQRAGRAGRTAPGRCVRLWSALEHGRLAPFLEPEIERTDLAPTLLMLKGWHGPDPRSFPWFVAPATERLNDGEQLLAQLGACAAPWAAITTLGEQLARLPTHPRLGRLLLDARAAGRAHLGAALAALLGERDLRPLPRHGDRPPDPDIADACDRLDRLRRAEAARFHHHLRDEGIDPIAAREVARVRDDLVRLVRAGDAVEAQDSDPSLIVRLLLAAYPDRVAKRSAGGANTCLMVGGLAVELDRASCVAATPGQRRSELVLAYAVQGVGDRVRHKLMARQASELTEADLEAVFPGAITRRDQVLYDAARGTVSTLAGWWYADLCLRAMPGAQTEPAKIAACLVAHLAPQARALVREDAAAASFLDRCAWLRLAWPELDLPLIDDARLAALIADLCHGCRSRADVAAKNVVDWLRTWLTLEQNRALDAHAPERLEVPTGSQIKLTYDDPERPPVLAVRLQELFGLTQTPRLANGRVAVLLHLLGPNYRPEQVTQDLASFWTNTYPQVRKDLRSRYPKHSWPDNPLTAPAVRRGPSQKR